MEENSAVLNNRVQREGCHRTKGLGRAECSQAHCPGSGNSPGTGSWEGALGGTVPSSEGCFCAYGRPLAPVPALAVEAEQLLSSKDYKDIRHI